MHDNKKCFPSKFRQAKSIPLHTCAHTYVQMCTDMHVQMCACMDTHRHMNTHAYAQSCMHSHTHVCTHTHTRFHTLSCTHSFSLLAEYKQCMIKKKLQGNYIPLDKSGNPSDLFNFCQRYTNSESWYGHLKNNNLIHKNQSDLRENHGVKWCLYRLLTMAVFILLQTYTTKSVNDITIMAGLQLE